MDRYRLDAPVLDRFRRALTAHRDNVVAWLRDGSRADALLGNSNGDAVEAVHPILEEIDDALDRIERGTFGRCEVCSANVEVNRLELDFTTRVCLDHYSEEEVRALERDLELAAQVQQHLLPDGVPTLPGVEVAAFARPAGIVSGDYYDFFRFRGTQQGVALADVMGKGLAASMLMANLQASLRILGPEHAALDALAGRLNALFRFNLRLIRFISLFLLAIDEAASRLEYCNAGHHPPLLWEAARGAVHRLVPTGPALGLVPEPAFACRTHPFAAGDVLVLYTDGLVEARNANGEEFGEARLAHYLGHQHEQSPGTFIDGLRRMLDRFTGGRLHDDLSLLVIRRS